MLRETLPQGPHEADIRGLLPEIPYRKEFVNKNDVIEEQGLDDLRDILCSHERLRPWSDNPRLYALLRMSMPDGDGDITAQPFVVKGELAEGLSDYGLPFTTETLPSILKEQPKIAQRLLDLQAAVKSCSELMSFKDEALSGKHRVASNPPFVSTERLAVTQGAFGQVESVRNTKTKLVFARKSMLRSREGRMSDVEGREDRQWRLEHFRNEVEVLRKLHDGVHMVRFWGSYTHPEYFALLFQPVAERTLHDLLVHPAPISEMDSILLRKSFGCLAFGLSWLHSNMIRHKDIKPANILISNGSVLYCDFGSALDGSLRNTTQTEGIPQKRTPRYVSPETHRGEARSEASDVWSLGCVFLEMLTRLTAYNLDELLQSIHEIADISCSVQDVCYWMGVEDDILQTWITKLAEELGSEEPAGWTANMVKEDASKRPLAADLVCEIQRHWSAHADTSYIGQCCATSPAPSAPESRGPDRPSSPSIRVPSVMSLPTSINRPSIHGNDKVSPEPPSPRDTTQPPEPVSKVTPAKEPSELIYATMSNGRSHQATLVYEAQLSEAQMQFLEGPAESQETISRFATMRLYEFRSENVLHSTRQLMFLPNVQSDLSDPLSIWLPLADTSVEQHEAQLLLTWSDCNHHVTDFANGRTLHSRIYKCREPNNTLLIHFASESEARQFAGKVHSPSETQLLAQSDPIALSPDATEIRWGFTSNGELMQHSTPAEAAHTVQIIEDSASALRTNARGLLVKGQDATVASTSRIYWLPSVIDLVLGTDDSNTSGQSKPSVLVSGLQRPDYKSSVQNVHHSQKDVQGKCHHVELAVCCVSWCFKFIDDRHMFLDGFSEWSLRLCMSIKQLSRVNKMWKDKLYGKADLLFFVHEDSASAAVTFRLKDGEYGSRHWVTGRLPNSSAAERYGDMEASVKLSSYYRKESLHLGSMQATSAAAGSEDPAPEVKDDCLETVKLTFHSIADKIDFQHHVTQYYNFYGGARQEMHKSSVSSGSYTRRATGNSLSLQSTSSSSRRS